MSDHLPDCFLSEPWNATTNPQVCICDRLRAREQRVREEEQRILIKHGAEQFVRGEQIGKAMGYAAALSAARDAVEAVGQQHPKWDLTSTHYEDCWKHHSECALTLALAAIDALRGER